MKKRNCAISAAAVPVVQQARSTAAAAGARSGAGCRRRCKRWCKVRCKVPKVVQKVLNRPPGLPPSSSKSVIVQDLRKNEAVATCLINRFNSQEPQNENSYDHMMHEWMSHAAKRDAERAAENSMLVGALHAASHEVAESR